MEETYVKESNEQESTAIKKALEDRHKKVSEVKVSSEYLKQH